MSALSWRYGIQEWQRPWPQPQPLSHDAMQPWSFAIEDRNARLEIDAIPWCGVRFIGEPWHHGVAHHGDDVQLCWDDAFKQLFRQEDQTVETVFVSTVSSILGHLRCRHPQPRCKNSAGGSAPDLEVYVFAFRELQVLV